MKTRNQSLDEVKSDLVLAKAGANITASSLARLVMSATNF
jgi:hypothetical protein